MKKSEYKRMLILALIGFFVDATAGDKIEDHHAIFDLKQLLSCDDECAKKIFELVFAMRPNLFVRTE